MIHVVSSTCETSVVEKQLDVGILSLKEFIILDYLPFNPCPNSEGVSQGGQFEMSSRPAKWICSLEPLAQLPECKIPNTLFPFLQSESKEEDILFQDSRPVNVAHFRRIDKHSDLENLIAGYSRWIMAVTGLDHIAFMMTECEEEDLKSVILSVLRKGDGLLEWQAYEISLEASGLPVEIVEGLDFALCLKHGSGIGESLKTTASLFIHCLICILSVN